MQSTYLRCTSTAQWCNGLLHKSYKSVKTIQCDQIAYTFEAKDQKGRLFLQTCKDIMELLQNSKEWKKLPQYERLYQ